VSVPACPPHYECTFTPVAPKHYWTHWYDGPWGIVVSIVALVAVASIVITLAYYWKEARDAKRRAVMADRSAREQREQQRFVEEQRTMQLDACKGDKELFKLAQQSVR
jgi:uncharacterized membrane protein